MHPAEIEACIESMIILCDSREQPTEEFKKRCQSFGCDYERQHLDYGDYTYNFILPNGELAYKSNEAIKGAVVIERKMSLEELSGNLCQEYERFRREFDRANENGSRVYLLVQEATWEKIINHRYQTQFNEKAYLHRLLGLCSRYGVIPIFTQKELSGRMIREILEKELRTRLENGDYDYQRDKTECNNAGSNEELRNKDSE